MFRERTGRLRDGGDLQKMSAVEDVDQLIEQFNLAQGEVVKGNAEPANKLFSYREDVTLANPRAWPGQQGRGPNITADPGESEYLILLIVGGRGSMQLILEICAKWPISDSSGSARLNKKRRARPHRHGERLAPGPPSWGRLCMR